MKFESWVYEIDNSLKHGYKIKSILFNKKSKYQEVTVVETIDYGKALYLDGTLMLTEKYEFFYHEAIVHPALFVHPKPENILIIGGGDGGTLREVLKHSKVKKVDMVEIDEMVVEVSKKFFPTLNKGFRSAKVNLMFQDGIKYVAKTKKKYDIIIIDSTDPEGPAVGLFNESFYKSAYKILKDDGIIVAQIESPLYCANFFKSHFKINKKLFPIALPILGFEPDYPYGMWGYSFLSKQYHPINDFSKEKVKKSKIKTKYYNEDIHYSLFSYPNFVKEMLNE